MPGMNVCTFGNNFSISINVNSREEADHFLKLSKAEMLPWNCKIHFGELFSECGRINLGLIGW
jgi:hypothetical protein